MVGGGSAVEGWEPHSEQHSWDLLSAAQGYIPSQWVTRSQGLPRAGRLRPRPLAFIWDTSGRHPCFRAPGPCLRPQLQMRRGQLSPPALLPHLLVGISPESTSQETYVRQSLRLSPGSPVSEQRFAPGSSMKDVRLSQGGSPALSASVTALGGCECLGEREPTRARFLEKENHDSPPTPPAG